jgi:hypothetical protein
MKHTAFQAAGILIAALATVPAWAETPGHEGVTSPSGPVVQHPDRRPDLPASADQQESTRHFEAKKRERLIQMLQLDEATREKLLHRLEQLDQKGEDLRRQRHDAILALREQAKSMRGRSDRRGHDPDKPAGGATVNQEALKGALDRVYTVEDALVGLRRERWQVARDLLTPEQQVRFLMYSVKLHKEMRQRLEREQGLETGRQHQSSQEQEKR